MALVGPEDERAEHGSRIQELQETIDGLRRAMETRATIEQAKGVIVAQRGGSPDEAFEVLRAASQRSNRKLHVIAAEIVARAALGPTAAG